LPASGRSRFGVLIPVNPRDRYSRTDCTDHRPCGFSPSAEQSGVARTGGRFGLVHAHVVPHTCSGSMMSNSMSARHLIRSCECFRGNRRSRSRGPNHSSASASIRLPSRGHAPSHSLSAVFRYPSILGPSRPGRTCGPSLIVRRRSWGSFPSQIYSRIGWADISAFPGPHAVHAFCPPRFIFVGVIPFARSDS